MLLTLLAYAGGIVIGVSTEHGGPRLRRSWPIYLRVQLLATAVLVTLASSWRLTAPHQLVGPITIALVGWLLLAASYAMHGHRSTGMAAIESWAGQPNGAFWVLPMAGALVGPTGVMIASLANVAILSSSATNIHLMRRDAPTPQRRSTSWVDQSPILAVALGLLLHLVGPAPMATHWVLSAAGPVLAFVGAAMFVGSMRHPHNLGKRELELDGTTRWLALTAVRVGWLVPVAVITSSHAVAVVAILSALGAPSFNPTQLSILYGYRSAVVNIAARWTWVLLPLGYFLARWVV
jgi:hypothetical protein